jgi:MscS family membrane protein
MKPKQIHEKISETITEKFNEKIPKLNASTLILLGLYVILEFAQYLHVRNVIVIPEVINTNITFITLAIITFLIINIVLKLTMSRIAHKNLEIEERIFYSKTYIWGAYALGIFFILYNLGVSISNLTILLALVASGLAFAIRDVLLAIISWLILLRKKPFRIGDYIKIGDDEGEVKHIGTFHVILDKTPETRDDFTRVPNKTFLEKSIHNYGKEFILETIKLKLKKVPSNTEIATIRKSCERLAKEITLRLEYIDSTPNIIIEYIVSHKQRKETKTLFVQKLHAQLKKFL